MDSFRAALGIRNYIVTFRKDAFSSQQESIFVISNELKLTQIQ